MNAQGPPFKAGIHTTYSGTKKVRFYRQPGNMLYLEHNGKTSSMKDIDQLLDELKSIFNVEDKVSLQHEQTYEDGTQCVNMCDLDEIIDALMPWPEGWAPIQWPVV